MPLLFIKRFLNHKKASFSVEIAVATAILGVGIAYAINQLEPVAPAMYCSGVSESTVNINGELVTANNTVTINGTTTNCAPYQQ